MQNTPKGNRLHIGLFGKMNSGKSSALNALTGQSVAIVSNTPGTTTDSVEKAMELPGIGPVLFIDTAGFDDIGDLGALRAIKTKEAAESVDIALLFFEGQDLSEEIFWLHSFEKRHIPVIPLVSFGDEEDREEFAHAVRLQTGLSPLVISAKSGEGLDELRQAILRRLPEDFDAVSITGSLASAGDVVLLVMPQDKAAPKGRLILPQVQTLRELMDKKCIPVCTVPEKLRETLAKLKEPPKLIITDSQAFKAVHELKPKASLLTSFSVLFAGYKGDAEYFRASAEKIGELPEDAHILIAEACTHSPIEEDIGTVKIPRLLKKRLGDNIKISFTSGKDFPTDLSPYNMVIHCGACMFNRRLVLSRVALAKAQNTPMTNYGIAIAYLLGILGDVVSP